MSPWYASRPLITFGRSFTWPRFHTITSLVEILSLEQTCFLCLQWSWTTSFGLDINRAQLVSPNRAHLFPLVMMSLEVWKHCLVPSRNLAPESRFVRHRPL